MYRIDLSMLYLLAMDKFSASVLKSIFRLKFARESTCASVVIHTPGCKLQYITKDACFNVSYRFFFFFFCTVPNVLLIKVIVWSSDTLF